MLSDLLAANAQFAESFDGGDLPRTPARGLLVLTCMDARIDTLATLGLHPGDAHVLRNAGGRASDDVIRSLVVSSRLLGVHSVVVMHHTQCGMATLGPRDVDALLSDIDQEHRERFDLLAIEDQQQALRDDVAAIRNSPLLPPLSVEGVLYDVATGRITPMADASAT